jgi:hypothetical protein
MIRKSANEKCKLKLSKCVIDCVRNYFYSNSKLNIYQKRKILEKENMKFI